MGACQSYKIFWKCLRSWITASQSTGNFWNLTIYVCTLTVRSSRRLLFHMWFACFCSRGVPFLRCENNLWDILMWMTVRIGAKVSVWNDWQFCSSYYWQPVLYYVLIFRIWQSACSKNLCSSTWVIQLWKLFGVEELILRVCQWVVNKQWRVFEPKVKFWKVKFPTRVHFQQKWLASGCEECVLHWKVSIFLKTCFKILEFFMFCKEEVLYHRKDFCTVE